MSKIVPPDKLFLCLRLHLSVIGRLVILPFTIFSNLTNSNSSSKKSENLELPTGTNDGEAKRTVDSV